MAVRSVLNQSYSHFELLLVDDGSTDNSLEIAKSFSDSRVTVVSDGINRGLASRLNQITRSARGTYVVRMDADDIMVSNRVSMQVEYLVQHPAVDAVGSAAYLIDEDATVFGLFELEPLPTSLAQLLRRGGLWAHPTITGKLEWFRANPYDTSSAFRLAQDYELWCRSFPASRFAKLHEPLLFYRVEHNLKPKKYWETGHVERRIIRTYGTPVLSANDVRLLVMRSWIRTLRIVGAQFSGLRKSAATIKRGFRDDEQRTKAYLALREALAEP